MRPAWISLLFVLAACNGDETLEPIPVDPTPVQVEPDKPDTPENVETDPTADPWDGLEGLDKARSLTAARKFRDAVKELEALLTSDSDNGSVWALLGHAAIAGGESGELLDRLDAGTAIGGQEVHHWRLRAELALDADRADDALASARKLAKADAELGAVYTVRAMQAGATFDTKTLDKEDPNDALVLASTEKGSRQKRTLGTTTCSSWQGLMLRAELWDAAGDEEAADTDRDAALKSDDLFAHVAAGQLASALEDRTEAAERAADAARSATELGLAVTATDYTLLATDLYIAAMSPAEGLAFATEMRDAREAAKDAPGTAWTNLAIARAATANGQVDIAHASATAALDWAEAEKDGDTLAAAAWQAGLAAYLLGDDEGVAKAASLSDDGANLEALGAILVGDHEKGQAIKVGDYAGSDAVLLNLAGARAASAARESAIPWCDAAIKAADASGHLPDRVMARLEKERFATAEGAAVKTVLAELGQLAEDAGSDALRAEVAVRSAAHGITATLPDGSEWAGVVDGGAVEGDSLPAQFSQARNLAREGRFDKAYDGYQKAFAESPSHHRGPWAPLSVLDGRSGPGIDGDIALLVSKRNTIPAGLSLLVIHEWWHGAAAMDNAFAVGDDPSTALEAEERVAYNTAHRHLQARSLMWLCGAGDEPTDARQAVVDADVKAKEDTGFARALPTPLADYRTLRENLGPVAIMSYRLGPKTGEAVALTKSDAYGVTLDNPAKLDETARTLAASLNGGIANGGGQVSPIPGDSLRVALLDPFQDVISGTARYLMIPDAGLWSLNMNALPEQQTGRRYLADIRTIGYATTVASAYADFDNSARKYSPEYLGLSVRGNDKAIGLDGTRIATETENSGRHFITDMRAIASGEEATAAMYKDKAAKARFIHLAEVTAGPRGSIVLGDGETVTLNEIRESDLWSLVTVLVSDADPRIVGRWTQAFHAAGVPDVLSTRWATPLQPRSKYLFAFYENYMQETDVPRAMTGARNVLTGEEQGQFEDPSWWGTYVLSGKP
jgi:hypothetical protein